MTMASFALTFFALHVVFCPHGSSNSARGTFGLVPIWFVYFSDIGGTCWREKCHELVQQMSQKTNYFTSSDPHRDIILKHIRHKFWHSFRPSVSRFHQNYPLLLVPSPGSGSSSDHCDLSSQTDSNWLSLCLIQNNFRRLGVSRRLGAWKLSFERYKTIWLSKYSGGYVSLQAPRRLEFNRDRSIETFFVTFLRAYLLTSFSDISSDILFWHIFWHLFWQPILTFFLTFFSDISSDILCWHNFWHSFWHSFWHIFWHSCLIFLLTYVLTVLSDIFLTFLLTLPLTYPFDILVWHMFWHFYWHSFWRIFWHSCLTYFVTSFSGIFFDILFWHIFWHSFWRSVLTYFLALLWHFFWHIFWHITWHFFWHSF